MDFIALVLECAPWVAVVFGAGALVDLISPPA